MGLFDALNLSGNPGSVDWEMTPEYAFGTFESWGGKERVRSSKERIYYFFIEIWDEDFKLCLMERGIKHARVVAEILAPPELLRRCVARQGRISRLDRACAIDNELKQWLISNVIEGSDNSKVVPIEDSDLSDRLGPAGLPGLDAPLPVGAVPVSLPDSGAELTEEEAGLLVKKWNLLDLERNHQGTFTGFLVDSGDSLTVTDKITGLMWQRSGLDIMSIRMLRRVIEDLNQKGLAGHSDWRLPTLAEALSLMRPEANAKGLHVHPAFSADQPFIFVEDVRRTGGQWFVDFKQGRAYWASGTIPGGFGRLCRKV
jgi:hypothetical protein